MPLPRASLVRLSWHHPLAGLALLAAARGGPAPAGEIQPATDAPRPRTPEESARLFRVPPGFRLELLASEPLLQDPVAVDFDAGGRLFACELHGYNLDGHLDVQELNKTGVLDRTVRRIPASPKAQEAAARDTYGTVKLLEDTDGDGRMDRARVWADHLPPCYGLVAAREGVIVTCAPDVVYIADIDGDGEADRRETLFTGFGAGELWTRINHPCWGLDNWIYVAPGAGSGGTIRGPYLREPVALGSTCFRFKADGTALEPETGGTGGFGHAFDDWGDRFLVTNSNHALYAIPLPYRYLRRNPATPSPVPVASAATYDSVYPVSDPHPWRLERSRHAEWVRFYGEREASVQGYFTAACAPLIYRAAAFAPAYRGSHFTCESQQNLIHRALVKRQGSGFVLERAPGEEQSEFLSSSEKWFRPVNLALDPDGALVIVDMYREIIEDYSAIPRYLQQQYGLIAGHDRGRLWRLAALEAPGSRRPRLAAARSDELARELENESAWWRLTAQRLLVERGDRSVAPELEKLAQQGRTPEARLHALYTLDGLGALEEEEVRCALADAHFAVRLHALRLAERWLREDGSWVEKVAPLARDSHPRVRLQLALSLGESEAPAATRLLAELALRHGEERWMDAAILSSAAGRAQILVAIFLEEVATPPADPAGRGAGGAAPGPGEGRSPEVRAPLEPLARALASVVGARRREDEVAAILEAVAGAPEVTGLSSASLEGLLEGLGRGEATPVETAAIRDALRRLLAHPASAVGRLAFRVAAALGTGLEGELEGELEGAFARLAEEALDRSLALVARRQAVELLEGAPAATLEEVASRLLDPREAPELQLAAARVLSRSGSTRVADLLLAGWPAHSPALRRAALDGLTSRQDRIVELLDALEAGTVAITGLESFHRLKLLENPEGKIRERARGLLSAAGSEAAHELELYARALEGGGDPARGKEVFVERCAQCHRVDEIGHTVGPDLRSTMGRSDSSWLLEVLDPSARIAPGYESYTVVARRGRIEQGVLAAETATSITLRQAEGAEAVILRRDIVALAASERSLMPDDLMKDLAPCDLASVLAYLRGLFGATPPDRVVLFDDDPAFVAALGQGGGKATLVAGDAYRGQASLRVTPLQRYSDRIPGWEYRIRAVPQPGEYRYLRWAWRSPEGEGVMIELAAGGRWPAPGDPARRYASGRNTTEWQAKLVSPQVPRGWTVVTVDLCQDCGDFTLTGIAPTAMGDAALFDRIELLRRLDVAELEAAAPERGR